VGPSFGAIEIPGVVEALLDTYRSYRNPGEAFIQTLRRVGHDPFKAAANAARLPVHEDAEHVLSHKPGYARDVQEA
jgi:sulfite reductase (NADPH) hemoprotein beta-component